MNKEKKVGLTKKNQKLKYTKFSTTRLTVRRFWKSVMLTGKNSYYFSNWYFNVRYRWESFSAIGAVTYRGVLQLSCAVTCYRHQLQGGQIGKVIVYRLACWCDIKNKGGREMNLIVQDKTHIQISVSFSLWSCLPRWLWWPPLKHVGI